jgi:hypothetical protein
MQPLDSANDEINAEPKTKFFIFFSKAGLQQTWCRNLLAVHRRPNSWLIRGFRCDSLYRKNGTNFANVHAKVISSTYTTDRCISGSHSCRTVSLTPRLPAQLHAPRSQSGPVCQGPCRTGDLRRQMDNPLKSRSARRQEGRQRSSPRDYLRMASFGYRLIHQPPR